MQQEHYLVVGLGVTGLSVVDYLESKNLAVTVTDSRAEPPRLIEFKQKHPHVPLLLGKFTIPEQTTVIVLSPGVALSELDLGKLNREIPIIGDIELFARVVDKPVIAITGSNGKSTVTTLLGEMAKNTGLNAGVGGNLGTPALSLLAEDKQCYILELSSFQLETVVSLKPLAVTVLNISPDHMDRYADILEYQHAKLRIYNNAQNIVYNREDKLTKPASQKADINYFTFGLDEPIANDYGVITQADTKWLAKGQQPLMPISEMAMLGKHNVANALAALALGEIAGFSLPSMLQTLREFKGLEHRCEKVAYANQILWVNDSKGTNVAATETAIYGLAGTIPGKWFIILGGLGKNADFRPLLAPIQKYCRAAILIGTDAPQLWDLLHTTVDCYMAKDLDAVMTYAIQNAQPGDGVLLSPACASMDMFENYEHRGKMFKQLVLQRIEQHERSTS